MIIKWTWHSTAQADVRVWTDLSPRGTFTLMSKSSFKLFMEQAQQLGFEFEEVD